MSLKRSRNRFKRNEVRSRSRPKRNGKRKKHAFNDTVRARCHNTLPRLIEAAARVSDVAYPDIIRIGARRLAVEILLANDPHSPLLPANIARAKRAARG